MKVGQIKIKAFSAKFRLPERTVSGCLEVAKIEERFVRDY